MYRGILSGAEQQLKYSIVVTYAIENSHKYSISSINRAIRGKEQCTVLFSMV